MSDRQYEPELADDARRAAYVPGTRIEIVRPLPDDRRIAHALFDHDGTVSTLREGWQGIMAAAMERAILGPDGAGGDSDLAGRARRAVDELIEQTTGAQTLVQMQALVTLVRRFGRVPDGQVLDMHGYKEIYNRGLMARVGGRLARLRAGELSAEDFRIRGVRRTLEALRDRDVRLYLASGTDQADVLAEAELLGYAGLFQGRIYGAVGDIRVEPKARVLEAILAEHHLGGPCFAVFGDGPVEIRLARKHGGVAVGVASDEVRRGGLDAVKRTRLIRAGADLIVGDYAESDRLVQLLLPQAPPTQR